MSVVLVIQHAKRMRRIILSPVAYLALLYFSTVCHKWHDFRKKFTEHEMCLICSTTSVSNISHSKKKSARYYHSCTNSSCKIYGAPCRLVFIVGFK